ncbi:hypothetical protein [Paludisphaera mucosa]|uniref:Uncharacterized protein n=1 Tax=Paludisphaera mucosa TaxID=3030827 RepID=A0ABT6F9M8_9BACT|nr:hypothetical protein [Paludisphaera mucosa]MDG3004297.1 hypothetical protein [Paludisphaera mucosa]
MSTAAIVAIARKKERRIVEHLREAGAVDAASATPVPVQNWLGKRVLRHLLAGGAVHEAEGGYYLDAAAYAAYRSRRARTAGLIVVPLAIAAAFVIWWASIRGAG